MMLSNCCIENIQPGKHCTEVEMTPRREFSRVCGTNCITENCANNSTSLKTIYRFANGWFTSCDGFFGASACWLSHMKQ